MRLAERRGFPEWVLLPTVASTNGYHHGQPAGHASGGVWSGGSDPSTRHGMEEGPAMSRTRAETAVGGSTGQSRRRLARRAIGLLAAVFLASLPVAAGAAP